MHTCINSINDASVLIIEGFLDMDRFISGFNSLNGTSTDHDTMKLYRSPHIGSAILTPQNSDSYWMTIIPDIYANFSTFTYFYMDVWAPIDASFFIMFTFKNQNSVKNVSVNALDFTENSSAANLLIPLNFVTERGNVTAADWMLNAIRLYNFSGPSETLKGHDFTISCMSLKSAARHRPKSALRLMLLLLAFSLLFN